MYNVLQEAQDNNAQEKILFNAVLTVLGQHCTAKNLIPDNIAKEKTQCNVIWISLFVNCYFGLVNFLIITGYCNCRSNISQISTTLHKKNPESTLNKKTRLYRTALLFQSEQILFDIIWSILYSVVVSVLVYLMSYMEAILHII